MIIIFYFYIYRPSTDFEVHRNWKDITTTLTIDKWYFDERSEWTLDYPPFFAYMEFLLGKISDILDNKFHLNINIHTENNISNSCLYFQRATVLILGDMSLFFALKQ